VDRREHETIARIVEQCRREGEAPAEIPERVVPDDGHVTQGIGEVALRLDQRRIEVRNVLTKRVEILQRSSHDIDEGLAALVDLEQGYGSAQPKLEDEGDDADDHGEADSSHHHDG